METDWIAVVSVTVGVVSIILAAVAIVVSLVTLFLTKGVLAEIKEKASVIEGTVNTTQNKLLDTVTDIARPREETEEDRLKYTLMKTALENPSQLRELMELFKQFPQEETDSSSR